MRCCVAEDYVAMCTACKKAVDRKDLQYVNGLSYHTACSAQSGSNAGFVYMRVGSSRACPMVPLLRILSLSENFESSAFLASVYPFECSPEL